MSCLCFSTRCDDERVREKNTLMQSNALGGSIEKSFSLLLICTTRTSDDCSLDLRFPRDVVDTHANRKKDVDDDEETRRVCHDSCSDVSMTSIPSLDENGGKEKQERKVN